jgi:hypothetical protein
VLEAARFAETREARFPGFGATLFTFVQPLFPDAGPQRMRIIQAACLLHDVSWRAHPDYRAETCFDNATRANLGGLRHWERVFLGLALMHRYRNKVAGTRFAALSDLLTEQDRKQAEVLGRAMRFGAMLWLPPDQSNAARLTLLHDDGGMRLRLTLAPEARALFGEVAEVRFASLASALEAAPEVVTTR